MEVDAEPRPPDPPLSEMDEERATLYNIIEEQSRTITKLESRIESLLADINLANLVTADDKNSESTPPTLSATPSTTAPKPKRARVSSKTPKTPLKTPVPTSNFFAPLLNFTPAPTAPTTVTTAATQPINPLFAPLQNSLTLTPATTSSTTTATPPTKPTDQIPPTIIHNKDLWVSISLHLKTSNIRYTRATNTREGIRVLASTVQDLRALHKFLDTANHSYHSFQLPSERTIKVVFRGVPQSISNEQVVTSLTSQGYIPLFVSRLNGRNNRPAPLVLVQVERRFQSIFNLKTLCGLDITVEAKKLPTAPLQCHRCQRFGHTQPNCHAPYRCMKCADSHSTHLCPKPTTTPASCANCESPHISTHHSCPQNPINRVKSYAQATKPSTTPRPPTLAPVSPSADSDTFATLCFPLFKALLATNPTPERVAAFTTQLAILKQTITA